MPATWTTNVYIPSTFKVSYNGKDCVATSDDYNRSRGFYICTLENPEQNNNAKEGAKYYINGQYLENGNYVGGANKSYAYKYTFNNVNQITLKIVAPYLYDVDSRKVVETNVTVFEKTFDVKELYNNRHNSGENEYVQPSIPTIW